VVLENLAIFTRTTLKPRFYDPISLKTTRKRKKKERKRAEEKKGLVILITFILPTMS